MFPIWILSRVTLNAEMGKTYEAIVRIDIPPPFAVPVLLKVVAKAGRELAFEVARQWYVEERNVGSPVGARWSFKFPSK